MRIGILNGPNLNMLGSRDVAIYGSTTLSQVEALCAERCAQHGFDLDFFQSNHEGALVDQIQAWRGHAGLIINAGALSHTSIAIPDALELADGPIVEVHISNIHGREPFRHHSFISSVATGLIVGMGANGYALAIDGLAAQLKPTP